MSDLIDRQAAMDVIKEFKHGAAEWRGEQEERSDIWHRADSAIASAIEIGLRVKKLPSVQPQQWIPCSERLPEDGTWNIFTDGKRISIERYKFDIVSHFWPEPRWFDLEDAIAWMPLPEPWKGELKRE